MFEFLLNHAHSYLFGLVAFLLFIFLIARFGVGPLMKMLDARDRQVRGDLDRAREALDRAAAKEAEVERRLGEVELDIAEMRKQARLDSERQRERVVQDGLAEVEQARQQSLRAVDAARHAAIAALRDEVAQIATLAAGRIVKAELDPERHRELVLQAIAEVDDGEEVEP